MIRQLAFDLPSAEAMTREDFFVTPSNALALQTIDDWAAWPGRKLVLIGPEGSGKTHLAQVWATQTGATTVPADQLAALDPTALGKPWLVVEDADQLSAAGPAAEEQLFHLHNHVTRSGALLLTARTPPRDWGLTLPDLVSRMQAAPIARLDPPDDALLSAVLVKLFSDRQVFVPANLIPYLVSRMPRSIGAARALVATLDARSLALGRPITRSLAAEVMGSDEPDDTP